jgi:cytochrome c oxidase assembly protein subunit 15
MSGRWTSNLSLSPRRYQRITLVAVFLLAFIVVTGGAVRLAGSGLGCPDWPTCDRGQVVAPAEFHAWVEFGNRLVTGLVSAAVMLAVLGSLIRRPRRRDLVLLSLGLVAGVAAQIVLGGLVVLFHLAPPLVMAHFSLSMLIVLDAVVLHHRASQPDTGRSVAMVGPDQVRMVRLLAAGAAVVIFLGTVTTASGPHPGSNKGQIVDRLPIALHDAARMHGLAVALFLGFTLFTMWSLAASGAPRPVLQRAEILALVLVAQAAVGYIQYFTRLPVVLVGVHIAGATAVWVATLHLNLGIRAVVTDTSPEPGSSRPAVRVRA